MLPTKFTSVKFLKMFYLSHIILRIQRLEGQRVDLDEVANDEPHHDLQCLRIWLFLSLVKCFKIYIACVCMDGWTTCDFMSFLTEFQSYQDNERLCAMELCL